MSTELLLEELSAEQQKQKTAATATYRAAVTAIAQGRPAPPVNKLIIILKDAEKTREDLAAAIVTKKRRFALAANVAASKKLEAEREQNAAQQQSATDALAAAKAKYDETMVPLIERMDQLSQAAGLAETSIQQLHQTCDDEALNGLIYHIGIEIDDLARKIMQQKNARENRHKAHAMIENGKRRIAAQPEKAYEAHMRALGRDGGDSRDGANEVRDGEQMLAEANHAESVLPGLEKKLHELEAIRVKLIEQRLVP